MSKTENSRIWITGASSGIGRAAAKEFAKTGSDVYASARRATELERLQKELEDEKFTVNPVPCNVASFQNVDQIAKKYFSDGIDCLVNSAGITSFKKAEDNSLNDINDIITTNLIGSIYTIKTVLPVMIEKKKGTIINILSVVTQKLFKNSALYSASKSGLLAYSRVLREEVRKYNIRVIDIIPGATDTPIWPQEVRSEKSDLMMDPDDIARAIVWAYLQKSNLVTEEIVLRPKTGDL